MPKNNSKKGIPKFVKEILVVLCFVIYYFWPIGIFLLYRWNLWYKWVRITLIIIMLVFTVIIIDRGAWFVRGEGNSSSSITSFTP
jgi:ABC-type transport system involved in Fe-S cluster assembly fused permease/ATPase subunit